MQTFELNFRDFKTKNILETRNLSFPLYIKNNCNERYYLYDGAFCERIFAGHSYYDLESRNTDTDLYYLEFEKYKSVDDCILIVNTALQIHKPETIIEITADEYYAQKNKVLAFINGQGYTTSEKNEPTNEPSTPTEQVDYTKTFEELDNLTSKILEYKVNLYNIVSKIDEFRSKNKAQALILVGELKSEINTVKKQLGTAYSDSKTVLNQFLKKETDGIMSKLLNDWSENNKNGTAQD